MTRLLFFEEKAWSAWACEMKTFSWRQSKPTSSSPHRWTPDFVKLNTNGLKRKELLCLAQTWALNFK